MQKIPQIAEFSNTAITIRGNDKRKQPRAFVGFRGIHFGSLTAIRHRFIVPSAHLERIVAPFVPGIRPPELYNIVLHGCPGYPSGNETRSETLDYLSTT